MKFIDSFDRWWSTTGQFIPPCDTISPATREVFRQFAKTVSQSESDISRELEEALNSVEVLEVENKKLKDSNNKKLKDSNNLDEIILVMEDVSLSDLEKVKRISDLMGMTACRYCRP